MPIKLKISSRDGRTYVPETLRKEGFVGEVEGIPDAFTLVLIKPGTSLRTVKQSLEIVIKQIELLIVDEARKEAERARIEKAERKERKQYIKGSRR